MTPPKYLRNLGAGVDPRVGLPAGVLERDINMSLHPVVETLLEELPRRYSFPGVAKVYLQLGGPAPPSELRKGVLGVAEVAWESFDPTEYLAATRAEQQHRLLDALERGLVEVAQAIGADVQVIHDAATRVRQRPFPLPEYTLDELRQRYRLVGADSEEQGA